jgi:hypothetical protein
VKHAKAIARARSGREVTDAGERIDAAALTPQADRALPEPVGAS